MRCFLSAGEGCRWHCYLLGEEAEPGTEDEESAGQPKVAEMKRLNLEDTEE